MTYQVLARKWRPKSFESLVGQEHVVRALTHALDGGRLHHAYLFTGTRGVGKTTLSRIFAKALNCETGVSSKPCGVCRACREIDEGRFVDYVEMDAASNRGVDEMAALLERAVYAPVDARFKVYMIDEVHMLTNHAFNAMLKTLEEPPQHVKFILATTDPQKIPVTVLSRCLQFNLKQMPAGHIVSHLENILREERIAFELQALRLLSRAADGSMRDALSLTDQAIAYSANEVTEEAVRGMLGALDQSYLIRLLDALAASDGAGVLAIADEMALRSLSFSIALQDLASLLHRIAWAQFAPASVLDEWPEAADIRRFADGLSAEQVQLFYQIATVGRSELGLAPDEYAGFTMTLLRMLAFEPVGGPVGPGGGGGGGLAVSAAQASKGPRNAALAGALAERAVAPVPAGKPGAAASQVAARGEASNAATQRLAAPDASGKTVAAANRVPSARESISSDEPGAPTGVARGTSEAAGAQSDAPGTRTATSDDASRQPATKTQGAALDHPATQTQPDVMSAAQGVTTSAIAHTQDSLAAARAEAVAIGQETSADGDTEASSIEAAEGSEKSASSADTVDSLDARPEGSEGAPPHPVSAHASPDALAASPASASVVAETASSITARDLPAASDEPSKAASAIASSGANSDEPAVIEQIVRTKTPPVVEIEPREQPGEVPVASAPLPAAAQQAAAEAAAEAANNGAPQAAVASAGASASVPRPGSGASAALEVLRSAGMRLSSDRGGRSATAAQASAPAAAKSVTPKPAVPVPTPRRAAPRAEAASDGPASPSPLPGSDGAGGGQKASAIATDNTSTAPSTKTAKVIPPWEDMPPDDYPPPGSEDEYFSAPDDGYVPAFDSGPDDMRFPDEPAAARPAPKPDATPLPPAVSLDALGLAGEWATLAADLPLKGIAYQLAFNSELTACDAASVSLAVPVPQYADAAQVAKLKAALTEKLGRALEVNITVAPARRTAAALAAAERARRQQQAEHEIRQDPFVQSLIRDFGASIVQGSIKPVDAAGANPSGASSVR